MAVSIDDLLLIIGSKEAQIYELSGQLRAVVKENAELKKAAHPAPATPALPANVIPFPGVTSNEPVQ